MVNLGIIVMKISVLSTGNFHSGLKIQLKTITHTPYKDLDSESVIKWKYYLINIIYCPL